MFRFVPNFFLLTFFTTTYSVLVTFFLYKMRLEGIVLLLLKKPTYYVSTPCGTLTLVHPYTISLFGSILKQSSISPYMFYFLGFYDNLTTRSQQYTSTLLYFFVPRYGYSTLSALLVPSSPYINYRPKTIENIWPGISWQEREVEEMVGASFYYKRDSRSLFLLPMFLLTPLKKTFPTSGFYELSRCYFGGYTFIRLS